MTAAGVEDQRRVVLTPHPLQRAGALALCALAGATEPAGLTPEQFDAVVQRMIADAVRAGTAQDTGSDGAFWLKSSYAFFPNSPMNHPTRSRERALLEEGVARWRGMPSADTWPQASCALCRRQAVGFYGKLDVPLAASVSHRNTTPRGHGGLALCWPCVCSFHALPYGCVLTGGASSVLHSFDDQFLHHEVSHNLTRNEQHITLGIAPEKRPYGREAAALKRLRLYTSALRAGVELVVFSNSNREQTLDTHRLDQPMAEWLRETGRRQAGFRALLRAHRTKQTHPLDGLARNAFRSPPSIVGAAASYLASVAESSRAVPHDATDLAEVCRDLAKGVLSVNDDDIKQVEMLAANLATAISKEDTSGPLTGLLRAAKNPGLLRSHLQTASAKWLLSPPPETTGPLMTTRQFRLLFDPDGQSWLYRQLLTIAVLERLSELRWRPGDAKDVVDELGDELESDTELDNE